MTELEANKRKVNMVFQSYALFPFMNVQDNVGYSLKIKKEKKEVIVQAVKEALHLVQLDFMALVCGLSVSKKMVS